MSLNNGTLVVGVSAGDLHHPRADDTARGVPGENPDFGGQVRGCGHAESGEARKFKGHNHCISYMESAMTDCVEDDTHRRQNIKYQPRNMHNTTPLHMSRDNQVCYFERGHCEK